MDRNVTTNLYKSVADWFRPNATECQRAAVGIRSEVGVGQVIKPGRLIMDVSIQFHGIQGKIFFPVGAKAFDQLTDCGLMMQLKHRKQQHRFLIRQSYRHQDVFNFLNWDEKQTNLFAKQEIKATVLVS